MSKAKFTYDESGATFFYFVLSFLALILIPSTHYLWPSEPEEKETGRSDCQCRGCQDKRKHITELYKWKSSRRKIIRGMILLGWLAFIVIGYKCVTAKHEYVNWDPFEILGVREDASEVDIKKAYRKLSLIHHPDKETGDPDRFVKITKAYAALTDDEARKNWEQYGNPDGPGATSFGIALPSWIVEKENTVVVLGIYALIFMIALPVSVGLWWYKSVKYGSDKVLLATSEMYYYYIHKTPNMPIKRAIMIIGGSLEFAKSHNPEVIERPTDNQEVPRLIRDLPNFGDKNNDEPPLNFSFSVKTRAILYAHLSRMKLPPNTLEMDRKFIVRKCTYLIEEFVQCIAQLTTLALAGRIQNKPTLMTLENAMKFSSLVVQGLWEFQDPLLQLPHITKDTIRQFERRKLRAKTIKQLAELSNVERRDVLKNFTDSQYDDIVKVIAMMPSIRIESKFEVLDDEDPGIITAGSIVTVTVKLTRKSLITNSGMSDQSNTFVVETDVSKHDEVSRKVDRPKVEDGESLNETDEPNKNNNVSSEQIKKDSSDVTNVEKANESNSRQQKLFELRPRRSHRVHCPYYPDDKQEFWWVYIVDRRRFALITAPLLVTNLVNSEEVELKFTAPVRPGLFTYTIIVRSDSYLDCVIQKGTQVDVKPAKEYVDIPYDIPEDEDEDGQDEDEESAVEDSDLLTDTDDD